uniref:NADH dehydrogenase subunit 2 n=1 Tax=Neurobasis chinensis TaxID=62024 RepID=UPI0021147DA2|nr:NADH dehydrogenase subunit 2 [Neurobasis chinensis]UTB53941.1 NADH dehydrogenase subunit 2 [Neurobasis chinensis]
MNLSMMLFLSSMMMGTIISISSNQWIIMWVGLEMNLMSFIPMMKTSSSPYESEASMKYFLVQAMASAILMMTILMVEVGMLKEMMNNTLMMTLFIKMGAAPFHMWYPGVMQGLSWMNCLILMTWQKLAPMVMFSYLMKSNYIMMTVVFLSAMAGTIGTMNQTSIRKLMAYSSVSHISWMIMAMSMNTYYWMMYFSLYTMMNIATVMIFWQNEMFHLSQILNSNGGSATKMVMFTSILSLGGMPPFLGFIPKWVMIQSMMMQQNYMTIMVMVMSTLIVLYTYLRMTYSSFTMGSQGFKWNVIYYNKSVMFMSMMITLAGIPMITWISLT